MVVSTDEPEILQAVIYPEDMIMATEATEGPTVVNSVLSTIKSLLDNLVISSLKPVEMETVILTIMDPVKAEVG